MLGWLFGGHDCGEHGHRFEARYDERPGESCRREMRGDAESVLRAMELLRERVYVCDVCVRCGKTTVRDRGVPGENAVFPGRGRMDGMYSVPAYDPDAEYKKICAGLDRVLPSVPAGGFIGVSIEDFLVVRRHMTKLAGAMVSGSSIDKSRPMTFKGTHLRSFENLSTGEFIPHPADVPGVTSFAAEVRADVEKRLNDLLDAFLRLPRHTDDSHETVVNFRLANELMCDHLHKVRGEAK